MLFFRLLFASIAIIIITSTISLPIYSFLHLDQLIDFGRFTKWLGILGLAGVTTYLVRTNPKPASTLLGFVPAPQHRGKCLTVNLLIGSGIFASYTVVLYALNFLIPEERYTLVPIIISIVSIIPIAYLIAFIEEMYFRGIFVSSLQTSGHKIAALLVPAALYSAVHALNMKSTVQEGDPWYSGLTLLLNTPSQTCNDINCLGAGLVLFLFGVFLAAIRLSNASLYACIGIHAGFIVAIKASKKLTNVNPETVTLFATPVPDYFIWLIAILWLLPCCLWAITRIKTHSIRAIN